MNINLSNLNPAMEAAASKPIQSPRTPKFKGTEMVSWSDVDRTFDAFKEAYYERTGTKRPEKEYTEFAECPERMRKWISEHSILGNPKSETFSDGVVLPVVNPKTGKLNGNGVRSANAYASRVKGVSEETIKKTKKLLNKLYDKHFSDETSEEGLFDTTTESLEISEEGVIDTIKQKK